MWADGTAARDIVPPTRAARRWGPRSTPRFQWLERPDGTSSNHWKTYGLPCPDVGNRQDSTRGVM